MEFENLQAIWDTQNEKPVFAMQDARLLVALYQQRERSRRRAFRLHFAPMYVAALAMLAKLTVPGPLTLLQRLVSVPGATGTPSSETVPASVAVAPLETV